MLNNVIEKTCAFYVEINHYNTDLGYEEYTIVKLSEYNHVGNENGVDPDGMTGKKQRTTEVTEPLP